ncbi:hypothetical protein HanPI659440_Chr04g0145071 [Helianthus annuus]|nr:hypothetical protein HanPI659440_Chr04g0145071 [Helianthus annuus]
MDTHHSTPRRRGVRRRCLCNICYRAVEAHDTRRSYARQWMYGTTMLQPTTVHPSNPNKQVSFTHKKPYDTILTHLHMNESIWAASYI